MNYNEFIGEVQHRARLSSSGQAAAAIHATLQTLAERLTVEEARDLASQLPREIATHLAVAPELHAQRYSLDHFFQIAAYREPADLPDAIYHARVVMEVLNKAVSLGVMRVLSQLPKEYHALVQSGSHGYLKIG